MKKFISILSIVFALSSSFSDSDSERRIKILEKQMQTVGQEQSEIFTKSFYILKESLKDLEKLVSFNSEFIAATFTSDCFRVMMFEKTDSSNVIECHDIEENLYSVPFYTDQCVMIMRKDSENINFEEIRGKVYSSFYSDVLFDYMNSKTSVIMSENLLSALKKVVEKKADFMLLPLSFATISLDLTNFREDLKLSKSLFNIDYRIIVDKNDFASLEEINSAINQYKLSGKQNELYEKAGFESINYDTDKKLFLGPALIVALLILMLFLIGETTRLLLKYRKEVLSCPEK